MSQSILMYFHSSISRCLCTVQNSREIPLYPPREWQTKKEQNNTFSYNVLCQIYLYGRTRLFYKFTSWGLLKRKNQNEKVPLHSVKSDIWPKWKHISKAEWRNRDVPGLTGQGARLRNRMCAVGGAGVGEETIYQCTEWQEVIHIIIRLKIFLFPHTSLFKQ